MEFSFNLTFEEAVYKFSTYPLMPVGGPYCVGIINPDMEAKKQFVHLDDGKYSLHYRKGHEVEVDVPGLGARAMLSWVAGTQSEDWEPLDTEAHDWAILIIGNTESEEKSVREMFSEMMALNCFDKGEDWLAECSAQVQARQAKKIDIEIDALRY